MAINIETSFITSLSKDAQVLTDPDDEEFRLSVRKWSNSDIKTPAAILKPACEEDVVQIVQYALDNKIPFVAKSGGNTAWSAIGNEGWMIDFSLLKGININTESQTATIQTGVLTKALNVEVSNTGFCIQSPSGSDVGYIPFMLGGGSTMLAGLNGMAVDSLLSARVMTATKGLVTASETDNVDLFWALKGAGQFFGIVIEVTMKIFPLKTPIISWTCIFLPTQIKDVARVLEENVANGCDPTSPGMTAVLIPPGQTKPMLMVGITHFRPEEEAQKIMEPLLALNPIQTIKKEIPFSNMTDSSDVFSKQGGFKTFVSCGLQRFDGAKLQRAAEHLGKLAEEFPNASGTVFLFGWYSTEALQKFPEESTPWSHRDCPIWSMMFISAQDEVSGKAAVQSAEDFVEFCQAGQKESERAFFPNHTRAKKIEYIYRGDERLRRLRELKRVWDPEGVFTKQFL